MFVTPGIRVWDRPQRPPCLRLAQVGHCRLTDLGTLLCVLAKCLRCVARGGIRAKDRSALISPADRSPRTSRTFSRSLLSAQTGVDSPATSDPPPCLLKCQGLQQIFKESKNLRVSSSIVFSRAKFDGIQVGRDDPGPAKKAPRVRASMFGRKAQSRHPELQMHLIIENCVQQRRSRTRCQSRPTRATMEIPSATGMETMPFRRTGTIRSDER
jgi:hypothetical protein